MELLTYSEPKLLTYSKYKGNQKTKQRWKLVDKHIKEDLFALQHWRDYAEYFKKKEEAQTKFFEPEPEDDENLIDKVLVFKVKKSFLQKLARFHYLIEFIIVLLLDILYVSSFGFTAKKLMLFIPLAVASFFTLIYFVSNEFYELSVISHSENLSMSKYVVLRMGEPGAGKSSSGIYDSIEIADKLWKNLQFEYWKLENKITRIYSGTHLEHKVIGLDKKGFPIVEYERKYTGDEVKIRHVVEVVEAYEFYSENNCIPCFWSNIPIFKDRKPACKFTADHLLQKSKLLYKGVAFLDEIGSMLPPELSNNKIQLIDHMFRFTRQYKDFRLVSTEQDGNATLISARRVTAENKKMIEQKHVLKPYLLDWIVSWLEEFIQNYEPTDTKVKIISDLRTYVNSVGFRKFKYEDYGNLEVGNKGQIGSRVKSFVLPPNLNCFYDDRTFRNLYACQYQSACVETFKTPVLSEDEIKKLFNQEIINRAYKVKKSA